MDVRWSKTDSGVDREWFAQTHTLTATDETESLCVKSETVQFRSVGVMIWIMLILLF